MILTIDGHVATIRLNRPQEHNRIEPADLDTMIGHVVEVNANRDVRVVVLASTGRTFSSGFHLGAIGAGAPLRFQEAADALASARAVTIAALQGNVHGGAVDLALCCDFRIGVEGMTAMVPAVKLGIPYYPSAVERFRQRVLPATAKRILILCEKVGWAELVASGYLDEALERERLDARVAELAAQIAGLAPMAAQALKAQFHRFDRGSAEEAVRRCLASADHREGLAAWMEKRTARFEGA